MIGTAFVLFVGQERAFEGEQVQEQEQEQEQVRLFIFYCCCSISRCDRFCIPASVRRGGSTPQKICCFRCREASRVRRCPCLGISRAEYSPGWPLAAVKTLRPTLISATNHQDVHLHLYLFRPFDVFVCFSRRFQEQEQEQEQEKEEVVMDEDPEEYVAMKYSRDDETPKGWAIRDLARPVASQLGFYPASDFGVLTKLIQQACASDRIGRRQWFC